MDKPFSDSQHTVVCVVCQKRIQGWALVPLIGARRRRRGVVVGAAASPHGTDRVHRHHQHQFMWSFVDDYVTRVRPDRRGCVLEETL